MSTAGAPRAYDLQVIVPATILLLPSRAPDPAALRELPRRLASTGRAVTGLWPFRVLSLARAIAEPTLLCRGLRAWDSGHGALLVARLVDGTHGLDLPADMPRGPVASALAHTLSALRLAGFRPETVELSARSAAMPEDTRRLRAVADLYRRYDEAVEGRFADPAAILRTAAVHLHEPSWLRGATALLLDDGALEPAEEEFLAALARHLDLVRLASPQPSSLASPVIRKLSAQPIEATCLAPLAPPEPPAALKRLRQGLFEPSAGEPAWDGSVELLTAPGEAAEVRALCRRLLQEAARGVPFEEMGVILPRPDSYTSLFSDLLERLGIPFRLHPSLPLRHGALARALLLLFRCRGLERGSVMELLTFAPVPFARLLGDDTPVSPARWDALSRDAGIVSGYERWLIGLRHLAETERQAAETEPDAGRRRRREQRVREAESLLRVVELLSATLDGLAGEASWVEWSDRLRRVFADWMTPTRESEEERRIEELLRDLAGLVSLGQRPVPWHEVEAVVEARLDAERMPLERAPDGSVHVGALDAMAGLPFRFIALPGLVEGGFPGVLRPDPFLLDAEREALSAQAAPPSRAASGSGRDARQLRLFDSGDEGPSGDGVSPRLATTQDRLRETRRLFHRAVSQATERLVLSYPRADPRTGRQRLPSLFFVAAASAVEGQPLGAADLERLVTEDRAESLPLEDALDRGERDRIRLLVGGHAAAEAVASGSSFFRQSRLAAQARWHERLTAYDGLVYPLPDELKRKLDPLSAERPLSASRLATFNRCGFQYLLQHVLRLEPSLEPEERKRLDPLERGSLFHEVAERFLRERRDRGELPVQDSAEERERLLELADQSLAGLVAGTPPRFLVLWERERQRFRETLLAWLGREARFAERATPRYFEVHFGLGPAPGDEPHRERPIDIDLGQGQVLRIAGKIDRIDERPDGGLVLRDYKTGRAPRDEQGIFKGGKQLQVPFYVRAAETLFPDRPVVEAFLDYVDGGRRVSVGLDWVRGEGFLGMLRELLQAIADGAFVQEPAACEWCDFTEVCGPKPLLQRRRRRKIGDAQLQRVLRLRDLG